MLLDASLIELMLAIGQNGYFPGEQSLATVQKLKVQQVIQETTGRPTDLPCLIFENEKEIHKYL
jgi:hypothetical protein